VSIVEKIKSEIISAQFLWRVALAMFDEDASHS
jgi:hypothetical protein